VTDLTIEVAERAPRRATARIWRGAVLPVVLLAAWAIVPHLLSVRHPLIVPLDEVLASPFIDESGREIWASLAQTLLRFFGGFALGAVAGLALGVLVGASGLADRLVSPSFNAVRQIALFAWIPLLTAWFGNGEGSKLAFIALSAFFPVALNTHDGLRTIGRGYVEVAAVLKLPLRRRILKLLLPGALPSIFIGLQIGLITAWLGTVGGEYMIGVGRGLGIFIAEARGQFRMDLVLLGVILLALIGFVVNAGFRRLFEPLLRWQGVKP